jgi:hypothetical protein
MMEKNALIADACHTENMHPHQPMLEQRYWLSYSRTGSAASTKALRKMPEFGFLMKTQQILNFHQTLDLKTSIMKNSKNPEKFSQLQLVHASFLSAFIKEETSKSPTSFITQ